jgi:hypothetical protein
MILREKITDEIEDPVLEQAMKHFKASLDAWSDAAYHRPRTALTGARHGWQLAASWALGGVLAVCGVAGVTYERQHVKEQAHIAAVKAAALRAQQQQAAEQAKLAAQQQRSRVEQVSTTKIRAEQSGSAADEDLLATVDSDVSRQVPAAMEPLAQMMDEDGTPDNESQ